MYSTQRVQYGGFVVALSGFAITRLFVAEALRVDVALPFLLAGLLPLVVGLAMTVYGVALAVGPFTTTYVNTITRWHGLGVVAMVVVLAITAADETLRGGGMISGYGTPLLVANVLLGGAVGGTLTGVRSGRTIQQRREIRRSANQALLVNRLLKHEVLNAATIIDGYASVLANPGGDQDESVAAIRESVERIQSTIDDVGRMAERGDRSHRIDVERVVREEIESHQTESDDDGGSEGKGDVDLVVRSEDTEVAADDRLALVFRELLENALGHGGPGGATVELRDVSHSVALSITDDGPGLPAAQRTLLEEGRFPEFDDPTAGFGLQIVRLLVVQFGGEIDVDAPTDAGTGTTITVTLPRTTGRTLTAETVGLSFPKVNRAIAGGVLAGAVMGAFYQLSTGFLPVVGSLYALESPIVGWITHLFHSVVFALLFAAGSAAPQLDRFVSGVVQCAVLGVGWGTVLWFVAAGLIMPAWLGLLGVPADFPNLTLLGFLGHGLWGVVLGVTYWGFDELDVTDRLPGSE